MRAAWVWWLGVNFVYRGFRPVSDSVETKLNGVGYGGGRV